MLQKPNNSVQRGNSNYRILRGGKRRLDGGNRLLGGMSASSNEETDNQTERGCESRDGVRGAAGGAKQDLVDRERETNFCK